MQFPGHSLTVHQSMSVPWDFFSSSHFISLNPPTRSLSSTGHWNVSLPSVASPWNSIFGPGRRSKHYTLNKHKFKLLSVNPWEAVGNAKWTKKCLWQPRESLNLFVSPTIKLLLSHLDFKRNQLNTIKKMGLPGVRAMWVLCRAEIIAWWLRRPSMRSAKGTKHCF